MTAKIIPFPSQGRMRLVPVSNNDKLPAPVSQLLKLVDRDEITTLLHWTPYDEYMFDNLIRSGLSTHEASAKIERDIAFRNMPDTGEDRLLLQAREALRFVRELPH